MEDEKKRSLLELNHDSENLYEAFGCEGGELDGEMVKAFIQNLLRAGKRSKAAEIIQGSLEDPSILLYVTMAVEEYIDNTIVKKLDEKEKESE